MLFLDVNEDKMHNAEKLQEMLDNKKNVFVLVYMIGCQPCKNALPEWNKLDGCKELNKFKNNNDIIVANVEQSMCDKMHHKDLENIMSFPTIKHIQHNDVHDYNEERNTTAFSKWIKSLIKKDGKLKDLNTFIIKNQNKTNYGNIDMLMKPKLTKKRRLKLNMKRKKKRNSTKKYRKKNKENKNTTTSQRKKPKELSITSKLNINTNKLNRTKSRSKSRTKSRTKSKSKSRRLFQKPLSYTKSLPI